MNRLHTGLLVMIIGVASLSAGCATSGPYAVSDTTPEQALAHQLDALRATPDFTSGCQPGAPMEPGVSDCLRHVRAMSELVLRYPHHDRIRLAAAVIHYRLGDLHQSQEWLDQLIHKNTPYPEARILRGRIALEQGNVRLAQTILESALVQSPDYPELRETLAAVYYTQGRYDRAEALLDQAERLGSSGARIQYLHGLIQEAQRHPDLACEHFSQAVTLHPGHSNARARLAGLSYHPVCYQLLQSHVQVEPMS